MRRSGLCIVKVIIATFVTVTIILMFTSWIANPNNNNISTQINQEPFHFDKKNVKVNDLHRNRKQLKKKDWHDHFTITKQLLQEGIGERGQPAHLDNADPGKEKKLFSENGFNAFLSDHISLNRSVPDIRYSGCQAKNYLAKLPQTSIVIPFYNEHWSTLLRSVYSILNRSPEELLKEIILVDDCSSKEFLRDKLDAFIRTFLPKVIVIRLPERMGLIRARLAGARKATAEVLIFLDSHIETNYNWLPPLLEPIALNAKACVCPFIDVIAYDTFEYRSQDEGARGAFDWEFYYKRLPLLPSDLEDRTKPFRSPIMAGGLFAIGRDFFWELGGYDEGLDIWGGEQYELSFKIWMCGGELLDAPCSRVGHIYRGSVPFRNPRKSDYLHKNYKRVAEVWMDEYSQYLYNRDPDRYDNIDAGDLTKQKEIRQRLNCKSFKWFMEEIAFDLTKKYPPVEPPDYAHGTIQSISAPHLCLDTLNHKRHNEIGLFACATNHERPHGNQNWALSWHKDIRLRSKLDCLDVSQSSKNAPVILYECHGQQGNQLWFYDMKNKWLVHGKNMRCLEVDPKRKRIFVNSCDVSNNNMKWNFGFVNETALKQFHENNDEDL